MTMATGTMTTSKASPKQKAIGLTKIYIKHWQQTPYSLVGLWSTATVKAMQPIGGPRTKTIGHSNITAMRIISRLKYNHT